MRAARALLVLSMLAAVAAARSDTISHVPGIKIVAGATDTFTGQFVSAAGDVNADGFADVIVCGTATDNPFSCFARVHSGLDGALLFAFDGLANHSWNGNPAAGAGDVNGDGHDDVIVGNAFGSSVTVHSGRDGSALYTVTGDAPGDGFGGAVAPAGDVDGDGRPDIIIGTVPSLPQASAYARVVSGSDGATLLTLPQESDGDLFGDAVAGAGDVDGDGHADLVVGAFGDGHDVLNPGFPPFIPPFWTEDAAGAVSVYSGADGSRLWTSYGDTAHDSFGWSVAPAGDIDGDGHPDVIAGSLSVDDPEHPGYARVLSGIDGSTLRTFKASGPFTASFVSTSGLGDVNGDGVPDLLVGRRASGIDDPEVVAYSGSDGAELFHAEAEAMSGIVHVAALGDTNGDGVGDFVSGEIQNYIGGGYAQLFVSQGIVAKAAVYGCGGNPAGSFAIVSGSPAPGKTLTLGLDDPAGTMRLPAHACLLVSTLPDAAFPCGTLKAGWGLSAPGAAGELLVSVAAPDPILILNAGSFSGSQVHVTLAIPKLASLVGATVYVQGALVDAAHRIGLTDAAELTIGVP